MEDEEIVNVIKEWYKVDSSFYAAVALRKHGVKSEDIFKLKGKLSYVPWVMVWSKILTMEKEDEETAKWTTRDVIEEESSGVSEDSGKIDSD